MSSLLPPVGTLFSESWDVLQRAWLKLLAIILLGVFVFGFALVVVFVAMMAAFGLDMEKLSELISLVLAQGATPSTVGPLLFLVLSVLLISFIALVLSAGQVVIVDRAYHKKPVSFGEALNVGFARALPLFAANVAVAVLVLGGNSLFFVPGAIFAILFGFSGYEIVLNKLGVAAALRESVRIVKASFFGLLGRGVLLYIGALILQTVQEALVQSGNGFSLIIQMVIALLYSLMAMIIPVVLYEQAKTAAKNAPKASLKPIVILSIVGYVIGALFLAGLISLFSDSNIQKQFGEAFQKGFQQEMQRQTNIEQKTESELNMMQNLENTDMMDEMMSPEALLPSVEEYETTLRQMGIDPQSKEGKEMMDAYNTALQRTE